MKSSDIQIFQLEDGQTEIKVQLDQETVWLNLNQIAELFDRDKSVISRHISKIFGEEELAREATVAKYATVQIEGGQSKKRDIDYFNLDVIISVGYRIRSKRGTQFRIWANQILKEYLIQGYSLNQRKLEEQNKQLTELKETVKLLGSVIDQKSLKGDEQEGLLHIISEYAYALDILDQYDYQSLEIRETSGKEIYQLTYKEAIGKISLVKKAHGNSDLFGHEKDGSFKSSLSTIYQTFDGIDLYQSIEEKAANLLYLVTKNHSFSDGNKRIAAFLFLYFLERNGILFDNKRNKRIADNTLVALTLMIAVSKPDEKEMMIKVIVNLINRKNYAS